jgi:hypothetical protein
MKTRSIVTSVAFVLAAVGACSNREREAHYARFQMRFADVTTGMSKTELLKKVGDPDSNNPVVAGGLCSDTPAATHTLKYELREANRRSKQGYVVNMVFVVCLNSEHKVVGRSFVHF